MSRGWKVQAPATSDGTRLVGVAAVLFRIIIRHVEQYRRHPTYRRFVNFERNLKDDFVPRLQVSSNLTDSDVV